MKIDIKSLKNYIPTNPEYNAIEVRTEYKKGFWLIAYLQEWEYKKESNGTTCFSFDMFASKKARKILAPMKRKNAKLIKEAEENFYNNETYIELIPEMKSSF